MRSSHRSQGHGAWLLLSLAITLASGSCAGGDRSRGEDDTVGGATVATVAASVPPTEGIRAGTGAPTPLRQPLAAARDADQDFLRHMLDHHETVIAVAHDQMMAPAGHAAHGGGADPAAFDSKLDAEKLEMLALLSRLYGEAYSPRADAPATESTSVGDTTSGSAAQAEHGMPQADLAAQLRAGANLTDRFLPKLTRPQVREVALRIRASQLELARMVPSAPAR